ncbi:helix-turn-helix transcriptional regulator [Streptomyces sp. NPDC001315]|uniref:helix-turn-helix transcriptional regulator n=1 Tax=Streptomyces sp. NPDC001315 TaxID=3364562 RepID=UPI0036B1ECC3
MLSVAPCLEEPPEVVNAGVGVHGVVSDHDVFRLPDLWQLHLYSYAARLVIGRGAEHAILPGRVSLVPPDTEVHYHYRGRSEHLYVHLRLPDAGPGMPFSLMQDTGDEGALLAGLLRRAVAAFPYSRARAAAEVWTVLWRVAELGGGAEQDGHNHPVVAAAAAHLEAHLADPLTVPAVARAAGVSPGHLTRLFTTHTGRTVVAYIRHRRLERARHLLSASTLPIPAVAAAVGIPDLQAFNKACHRELGAGPRAIRGR